MKRRFSIGELSGIIPRMKTKNWLPQLAILVGLLTLIGGGYALARRLPASAPGLPPLSKLDLASQTQNGVTASLDSYYADAMRLVFTVHLTGADVFPSEVSSPARMGRGPIAAQALPRTAIHPTTCSTSLPRRP